MTCRFKKVPVVFNKSLVDLENCTSFLKTTCDLLNSTCEIDLLKLLARHTVSTQDSPAVEPRSNPGSGKILMSENLRLYTTSPVVMC